MISVYLNKVPLSSLHLLFDNKKMYIHLYMYIYTSWIQKRYPGFMASPSAE